jgi:HPt (histidine-containing phosphotransfer) domain-containing protein
MGDEAMARELVGVFLGDMTEEIRKLSASILAGDLLQAERQAHKIKGASANLSANALHEAAAGLEAAAKSKDADNVRCVLRRLVESYDVLADSLKREILSIPNR